MRVDRPLKFFFFSHLPRKTKSLISVLSKCFSYCLMIWSWLQIKSWLLFTWFYFSNTKDSQRSRVREGQSLFISANSTSSKTFSSQSTTVQCMYLAVCYSVKFIQLWLLHCVNSVRIRSFSGLHFSAFGRNKSKFPYSVQVPKNVDHKNSDYRHFSRSVNI